MSADLIEALHQVGFVQLQHDTAIGGKKGQWVPAWRCCLCGWGTPCAYWHSLSHDCCNPGRFNRPCDWRDEWPEYLRVAGSSWVAERPVGVS